MIQRLVEMLAAANQGGEALGPAAATSSHWSLAVDILAEQGNLAALRHANPILEAAFPDNPHLAFISRLAVLAPDRAEDLRFINDPAKDYQAVIRPGSDCALLVFCGRSQRVGFPLGLAHHWLASQGVTVVYLRDFAKMFFAEGLRSIAGGYGETVVELRRRLAEMGIRRIVCYGNSGGTFAALRFGLDLEAAAILAFGGPSNLEPAFFQEHNLTVDCETLYLNRLDEAIDLRPGFLRAACPPRVRFYYGEDNSNDRLQAENLSGLPSVRLCPQAGCHNHNVVRDVVMGGQYGEALSWLVADDQDADAVRLLGTTT